jgi:hypothetical protein
MTREKSGEVDGSVGVVVWWGYEMTKRQNGRMTREKSGEVDEGKIR